MSMRFRRLLIAASLFLLVLVVYWPVRGFDFVNYDDDLYVSENPHVSGGLTGAGVRWAFTAFHAANWHPLTWLSHMMDCEIYSLRPGGHHLTSVLFHALNAVLVFLVFHRLLAVAWGRPTPPYGNPSQGGIQDESGIDASPLWISAFVAALFAIHPTHVESVAWISERKDVLSTGLGLLAIGAYARSVIGGRFWLGISLFCFTLALLAKPMMVTLPALLILLDYWPLGRLTGGGAALRRVLLEKVPFGVLSMGSVLVTLQAQWAGGAVRSLQHVPFDARLENALVSSVAYLGKLFWPHPLSVFYPFRRDVGSAQLAGALAVLGALTFLAFWQRRRRPYLLFGWLWYAVTVAPVIGLLQVGNQAMADRYTYLPSIGLTLALAMAAAELWSRFWLGAAPHVRQLATYCGITALILIVSAAALTTRAVLGRWSGSIPLFEQALRATRNNWLAHNNLAFALEKSGRPEAAVPHYLEAIRIAPDYVVARYNLGNLLTKLGRYAEAETQFRAAMQYDPRDARTLTNFGACLLAQQRPGEAVPILEEALALDAQQPEAFNNLGNAQAQLGLTDAAMDHYRAALRLRPDFLDARNNLAVGLADRGEFASAVQEFQEILRRHPGSLEARFNLGITLSRQGRAAEAIAIFQQVLDLAPGYADAAARIAALKGQPGAGGTAER